MGTSSGLNSNPIDYSQGSAALYLMYKYDADSYLFRCNITSVLDNFNDKILSEAQIQKLDLICITFAEQISIHGEFLKMNALLIIAAIVLCCGLITLSFRFILIRRDIRRREMRARTDPNTGEILDNIVVQIRRCQDPQRREQMIMNAID